MASLLKYIVPFVLITSVSLASTPKSEMPRRERADINEIYKKAFESARDAHNKQVGLRQSGKINTKPLALSSTEAMSVKAESWFYTLKASIEAKWKSFWRGTKKTVAMVTGVKSDPPETTGLYIEQVTNGPRPVYYIGFDEIIGDVDHMVWDFGDGTGFTMPYSDFSEDLYGITHTFATDALHTVSVSLYNSEGDFATATIDVNSTGNQLPYSRFSIRSAGGNAVRFNVGTIDEDRSQPGGSGALYSMKFGDGARYDNAEPTFSHTYPAAGSYLVKLATIDGFDALTDLRTTIYVGVTPPAGGSVPFAVPKVSRPPQTGPYEVTFDASHSFDLEGPIVSYEWNFGDFGNFLNTSTSPLAKYTYKKPGTYFAYLKVTDVGGNSTFKYFPVFIDTATSQDPEIFLYPTANPREFAVEGNAYAMKSVFETQYLIWDFGDGSGEVRDPYAFHTYAADGTYTVTLKIYDQLGEYKEVQKNIVVTSTVTAPNAQFYPVSSTTNTNTSLSFLTVNPGSVDPDTTAIWDFGDGSIISGPHEDILTVSHTYLAKGVYLVKLVTTNLNGVSSRYEMNVYVSDASTVVANIQISPKIGNAPLPVRLDASGSTSAAGPITDYIWAIYSPEGEKRIHGKTVTHSFESGGGYRDVALYVKDASGNETMAFDRVLVLDSSNPIPGNSAPVPKISISFPNSADPEWFGFNSTGSSDPDSDQLIHYEWFLDGKKVIGNDPLIYYRILENGKHRITLRITDVWGAVGEATKHFEKANHTNVTMDFEYSSPIPSKGDLVYFLASDAVIPGAAIKEKIWDFDDGNRGCCSDSVTHTFNEAGTYNVRLILKDYDGNTYEKIKSIVVASGEPTLIISARDYQGLRKAKSGSVLTLRNLSSPVIFDLNASEFVGVPSDIHWDFGDGNTGFGKNPTWIYHKPGTYHVQATATTERGAAVNAGIDVVISNDNCPNFDGINGCLVLNQGNSRILPLSAIGWKIDHQFEEGTFDANSLTQSSVILERLSALVTDTGDISERQTEIGDTATISQGALFLDKTLVLSKGLDLTKAYKILFSSDLVVNGLSEPYYAEAKEIYFGIGTLNISSTEPNVRFYIQGAKSGYRKFVSLGSSLAYTLLDLPADQYVLRAEKGDRTHTYNLSIANSVAQNLSIDLSAKNLERLEKEWKSEVAKSQRLNKQEEKNKNFLNTMLAEPYDSCGNKAPFKFDTTSPVPGGTDYGWMFGNIVGPDLLNSYFPVTEAEFGKTVKVTCLVRSQQTNYAYAQWLLRDGPARCWNGVGQKPGPSPAWNSYLQYNIKPGVDRPYVVKFDIKDGITGRVQSGSFSSSIPDGLAALQTNDKEAAWKIGAHKVYLIPVNISEGQVLQDVGFRFTQEIEIPKDVAKPQMKLQVRDYYTRSTTELDFSDFVVHCNVERKIANEARIVELGLDERAPVLTNGAKDNGERLLDLGFLPMSTDQHPTTSPIHTVPEIFKASLKTRIYKGPHNDNVLNAVQVKVEHGTEVVTFNKNLTKEADPNDPNYFFGYLELNANDWNGHFSFKTQVSPAKLTIRPIIPNGFGGEITKNVIPLFNVKTLPTAVNPCTQDFYSTRISAYASTEMINALNVKVADGANFRCNDFSLPWGGSFRVAADWGHARHENGRIADVRYAHATTDLQDYYDWGPPAIPAYGRVKDLQLYMQFSDTAKKIAEDVDYLTDKNKIFGYCTLNPTLPPCPSIVFPSQINHEFVVKFCLLRQSVDSQWIDGCPPPAVDIIDDYLEAAKRYAVWTEMNIVRNKKMLPEFSFIMSEGWHRNISPLLRNINWQKQALEKGLWPDGNSILKESGGKLMNERVVCNLCTSGVKTSPEGGHYHHTHYELK